MRNQDEFSLTPLAPDGSFRLGLLRQEHDVQLNSAQMRPDRRQRDLGEYMLNHPERP